MCCRAWLSIAARRTAPGYAIRLRPTGLRRTSPREKCEGMERRRRSHLMECAHLAVRGACRRSIGAFSTSGPHFRTRALPCASASSWQDPRSGVRAEPRGLRARGLRQATPADAAPAPIRRTPPEDALVSKVGGDWHKFLECQVIVRRSLGARWRLSKARRAHMRRRSI